MTIKKEEKEEITLVHSKRVHCETCRLNPVCLPIGLSLRDVDRLNAVVQRSQTYYKGDYLYRGGESFNAIYIVRSGAVKAISVSPHGDEQITGFYLPGEVLGMDGIAEQIYSNSVMALETTFMCRIPFARLEELTLEIPSLQRNFVDVMSRAIAQDNMYFTWLSKGRSEVRVASLITNISARNLRRGVDSEKFMLPLSRTDIGNFLGLTIETVSRTLSRLQKLGVISVNKKEVVIHSFDRLQSIAMGCEE